MEEQKAHKKNTDGGSAAYLEISKPLAKELDVDKLPIKYGSVLYGIELDIITSQ